MNVVELCAVRLPQSTSHRLLFLYNTCFMRINNSTEFDGDKEGAMGRHGENVELHIYVLLL